MEEVRTNRIGETDMGQGGDGYMESVLTSIEEEDELDDVTDQYVGPSALTIANLLTRTSLLTRIVRYRQDWFWTTTAFCHGGDSQGLAFRHRPDGNGIDVKCHTRGCSRDEAIAGLEAATGATIASAYVPAPKRVDRLEWLSRWPLQKIALYGTAALVFAAPLLLGLGFQSAYLSYLGYCVGAGLTIWFLAPRPTRRPTHLWRKH